MDAEEKEGLKLLWIPVGPSSYKPTKINDYQTSHSLAQPLSKLSEDAQEDAWVEICDKIQVAFEA